MSQPRRQTRVVAAATKWLAIVGGVAAPLVLDGVQMVVLLVVAVAGAACRFDERRP